MHSATLIEIDINLPITRKRASRISCVQFCCL